MCVCVCGRSPPNHHPPHPYALSALSPQLRLGRGWQLPRDAVAEAQRASGKKAELAELAARGKAAEKLHLKEGKRERKKAAKAKAKSIVHGIGRAAMVPVAVAGTALSAPVVALGAGAALGISALRTKINIRREQKKVDERLKSSGH